jgi:hypothetical protein
VFDSVFNTLINYHVKRWYYLTLTPVLISGLGICFYYAVLFLSHLLKKIFQLHIPAKYPIRFFFLAIFLFCFYGNTQSLKKAYMIQNREWEKVYDLFKYHSSPGDTAYIFNLVPPGKWSPTHFYSQKFYYNNESERYVHLKSNRNITDDFQKIRQGKQKGNIYIMILSRGVELNKSDLESLNNIISIHQFYRAFIVRILNNGRLSNNIIKFFYCLAENLPAKLQTYVIYDTLFQLEMAMGKYRNAYKILDTMKRRFHQEKLTGKITQLTKTWHKEKKERKKRVLERRRENTKLASKGSDDMD